MGGTNIILSSIKKSDNQEQMFIIIVRFLKKLNKYITGSDMYSVEEEGGSMGSMTVVVQNDSLNNIECY